MHIRVPILDFQFGQDFNYGKYLDHWALCVVWTWIPCLQFPLLYKQSTYFFDLGCMYFLYISKIAKSYSKNYKRYEKTLSYSPSFKSSTKSLDKMVNKRSFLKISVPEVMQYSVSKIVLTFCEKKLFSWSRNTFEIQGWRPRICKNFEITRTIYSNSERSDQFLVTECFFNLFLEVSHI